VKYIFIFIIVFHCQPINLWYNDILMKINNRRMIGVVG